MQVKFFWAQDPVGNPGFFARKGSAHVLELEEQINRWLSESPRVEIHHVEQSALGGSFNPGALLVSVWYSSPGG